MTDSLTNEEGEEFKFDPPTGDRLPEKGFEVEDPGYEAPAEDGSHIDVVVSEDSERLQLLTPFEPWDGENLVGMRQ